MKSRYFMIGGGAFLAILAGFCWYIYTSPWFAWGVSGEHSGQVYIGQQSVTGKVLWNLYGLEITRFFPSMRLLHGTSWPLGWEQIRLGVGKVIYVGRSRNFPLRPAVIAQVASGKVVVQEEHSSEMIDNGLIARIPGKFLASLPRDLEKQWDDYLAQFLDLSYTKPSIVQDIAQYDRIGIQIQGQDLMIATMGGRQPWKEAVSDLVANELGHRKTVTKAFRLPDGTLGYEKRPSEQAIIFSDVLGRPDCQVTHVLDRALFLCRSEQADMLTTDLELVRTVEGVSASDDSEWYVEAGKSVLDSLHLPHVQGVTAWGEKSGEKSIRIVIHTR